MIPTSKEGWTQDATQFWLMPAGLAAGVAVLFFLTFWDKSSAAKSSVSDDPTPDAEADAAVVS